MLKFAKKFGNIKNNVYLTKICQTFDREIFMKEKVNFNESQTFVNLSKSFASECMEGAKYQFIASQCENQNLDFLKTTFKSLAKHEMAHAKVFWDLIHQNYEGDIIENVDMSFGYPLECDDFVQSIECHSVSEGKLSDNIYPAFAKTAKEEGYPEIEHKFKLIATVENCHRMLLEQIHDKLKTKKLYKSEIKQKWKCSKCGFEHTAKEPPAPCPLCEYDKGYYEIKFDMGE